MTLPEDQNRELLVMGWLALPVEDWIWLLEFAQRQEQALETYLAHVLHQHVRYEQLKEER
jgi:hypothetical protein